MSLLHRTAAAALLAAASSLAHADPALTGTWSGVIDGQPLTVTFDGRGGGQVDGRPIRYQAQGQMLMVEDNGEVAIYQFQVRGGQLQVAGGQLPGVVTLTRGTAAAAAAATARPQARGGSPADLVGRWCKASSFTANAGGGSQSSACFELRPDGTYTYGAERSASAYGGGMWGGTSSQSGDAGRWSATATSITAHSQSGQVSTYQLERRNHPKNRDPMLCLDGECYVTYYRKAPW
ncbi:hypothetical protein [Ramlibacter sp.]|uniref:hypothetical protein n=1 Tax=Ramlibacter sp. TaxID=1917967 RepID=UPI0035B1272B